MLRRYLTTRSMQRAAVDVDFPFHPAVRHVERSLGWSVHCWVLWGLADSCVVHCLQLVAKEIIRGGGLAKIFYCDSILPTVSLREHFLHSIGCKHLGEFSQLVSRRTVLIFSCIDRLLHSPDTRQLVEDLISIGRSNPHLKVLLCTTNSKAAKSVLGWASAAQWIRLVYPIDCCRWSHDDVRACLLKTKKTNDTRQISIATTAGCPYVSDATYAAECDARWEMGQSSLDGFIQHEWLA